MQAGFSVTPGASPETINLAGENFQGFLQAAIAFLTVHCFPPLRRLKNQCFHLQVAAVSNAAALMSFSILASAMGFRYLAKEYCGGTAILLFSYPMNRKSVVWAKVAAILLFISAAMILTEFFGFLIFTGTDAVLGMVNESLQFSNFILALRNALVLVCLADGIILCAIRIGFIKKSNSVTIIAAVIWSLLLINPVAAINEQFLPVLLFAATALLGGILLTINLSYKVNRMER